VHVRVCRDCGEEYRPEIVSCADCGGRLEDRWEDEATTVPPRRAEPPAPEARDLSGYCPIFSTDQAGALVPLAERLREAGMAFHLLESPGGSRRSAARFHVLVPVSNEAEAKRVLAPLLGEGEGAQLAQGIESEFADGAYRRCPACGAELSGAPLECPGCGLALGKTEELATQVNDTPAPCARCGLLLAPGQTECPVCGTE